MTRLAGGRPVAAFITLAVSSILLGCSPPTTAPSMAEAQSPDAPLIIIETLPAGEPLPGEDLYPLTPGEWVYQIIDDEGEATGQVVYTVSPTDRFDALVSLVKGGDRTEFWALNEAGDIVMPATIEHAKNALTIFDPPLLIAPRSLAPGEPFESSAEMRVLDSRNPKRKRESGRATRTIEYVDDQKIRTPLGEFIAKRVVVSFKADLRFADADKEGTYWVVPGVGLVAQELSEEIRVLGLVSERTAIRLVLSEMPAGK